MDRRGYRRLCSEQKMGLSVKQTIPEEFFSFAALRFITSARRKCSALACRRSIITFFDRLKINRKRRNRDSETMRSANTAFSKLPLMGRIKYDQKGAAAI